MKVTVGNILKEEFLVPRGISQQRLSKDIHVSQTLINHIIKGEKPITADIAVRLATYFGTTPQFWLNAQNICNMQKSE